MVKESLKKGENSYYHAALGLSWDTSGAKEIQVEGQERGSAPPLLGTSVPEPEPVGPPTEKITKYSWNDEDTKIVIRVEND